MTILIPKVKNKTEKLPLKIQKLKKASNHKMSEITDILYTRSSGCYVALLLAPAEGWWPSATWDGPSGPPNDFLYSEWAYLGGSDF